MLSNSEEWYRRLLQTMNEGFTIRDRNTIFTYANDKFCEMTGYRREELIGRHLEEFVDKPDLPILQNQLSKRKRGERSTYELTWTRKDGKKLYTIMSAAPLFDDDGNFTGGFGIMSDITDRRLAEKKLAVYQNKLRILSSELSLAEERERRQIAGELHDRIGQTLAIIKMKLGTIEESLPTTVEAGAIGEIRKLVEQTIRDTRSLTMELSPPILYELGFEAAVEWLLEHFQHQHAVNANYRNDNQPKPLNENVRVLLFKIIQELLFNVIKHSRASDVNVSLWREEGDIFITVEDNGVGFDAEKNESQTSLMGGFGLFSIRERLDSLGGKFKIQSRPGRGTRATVQAPLSEVKKS